MDNTARLDDPAEMSCNFKRMSHFDDPPDALGALIW